MHFPHTNVTIYAKELVFEDLPEKELASLNTSPEMFSTLGLVNGAQGENAGNITLYVKNYKQSTPAKRFILIGGKGQNVPWNTKDEQGNPITRTAGKGGNGGVLTSTIDVSDFCDFIHGSAGIQVDNVDNIIGAGEQGQDGSFALYEKEFTWLHPNFISAVVKHAKDAYLNVNNSFTYNIFNEYRTLFAELQKSEEWNELSDELKMELTNDDSEMQSVMFRIGQNLDYFGNPVGWVPMLSFEVTKMAFEQEIEKAIRVMYLSYWLKTIDASNEERTIALNQAVKDMKDELGLNQDALNAFIRLVPQLQDELTALKEQLDNLKIRIQQKEQQLLAQAKDNVKKRNQFKKIAGVMNIIAKAAPVVCSIIPGVGTAFGMGISEGINKGIGFLEKYTNLDFTEDYGYGNAFGGALDAATGFFGNGAGFASISNALNSIDISSLGSAWNTANDAYKSIKNTVDPLKNNIETLHETFAKSSTPLSEVDTELKRLMAESREYQALLEEHRILEGNIAETNGKIQKSLADIITKTSNIQSNIASIDGFGRDVFNGNSKRDLRALQYLDDMERRAKERLLKYHYYMLKAYEYRLLKPYPNELTAMDMFDRLKKIAEGPNSSATLTDIDFQNLKAVYEEQISTVTATILTEFTNNRPSVSGPVRFSLTQEDLNALNSGSNINLNIFRRGMIPPNEENVRIVNFKIFNIKSHLEGDQNPSFARFDLLLEHSGRSMMRKDGQIYWFDHINNQTQNPFIWGIRYDAKFNIVDPLQPSAADSSLLYSLLDKLGQKNNIMIYSQAGAWSDILVSKNNVTSGNTKMVIDELTFELQYDFSQRPTSNRNMDVYAGDVDNSSISLSPYIEISRPDKNGRADGRGTLYRTYNSGTSVNLAAPAQYGRYIFDKWTDRYDATVSTKTTVTTNMSADTYLKANYKYTGPILSVVNSIQVDKKAQVISAKVENKGSEEMEWEAVSNDSWIKIQSGAKGTDTEYMSLEIAENLSGAERTGSITVTAPETAEYSREIKIVQSNQSVTGREQVNPSSAPKIIRNQGSSSYSVVLSETARNISLDVYSVGGQLVLKKYYYGASAFGFDLSHCSKGVYVVKINYDGKLFTQKLIR